MIVFLATYTGGSSMKTWQEAADDCTAAGTTLPIPRSEAEVHALCDSAPDTFIWTGIIKGAKPDIYVNYLDQSPAPYLYLKYNPNMEDQKCMALVCYEGDSKQYTYMNLPCDAGNLINFWGNLINFCEDPRKYFLKNITD